MSARCVVVVDCRWAGSGGWGCSTSLVVHISSPSHTHSPGPVLGVAQALSYIEAAAEAGSVPALRRLAEMHEQGEEGVVRKDGAKALKYYRCVGVCGGGLGCPGVLIGPGLILWRLTLTLT